MGRIQIPFPITEKSNKQKISKEILDLNSNINQFDLINVYRIFHPTTLGYTFLSSSCGIFTKIDQITAYKTSLNKFKIIEIIQSIFSEHSETKLEITSKRWVANPQISGH